MERRHNVICKVCKCENVDVKQINNFSETSPRFKDISTCASVQEEEFYDSPEQICCKCLSFQRSAIKIEAEYDDITVEETKILCNYEEIEVKKEPEEDTKNCCNFEESEVKKEAQSEVLTLTDATNNCAPVKIESATDLLQFDTNYKEITNLEIKEERQVKESVLVEQPKELSKIFKCYLCNKKQQSKHLLVEHLKIHKIFSCDVCKRQFTTDHKFKAHIQTCKEKTVYKCEICKKQYTNDHLFKVHMQTCSVYKCDICKKEYTKDHKFKAHIQTCTVYKCDICKKQYTKDRFKAHIQTCKKKPVYKCDICKKLFTRAYHFENHKQICKEKTNNKIHTREGWLKCNLCDKQFKHQYSLDRHNRRIHQGQKQKV